MAVNDMKLIGSDLNQIYNYFVNTLTGQTLEQTMLDDVVAFLDAIDPYYFNYVKQRENRYNNALTDFNQFLDDVEQQIKDIPNTPLFQSAFSATQNLNMMSDIFLTQYADVKADLKILFNKYYENFAIRFSGDIIALGHEYFDLKEAAKETIINQTIIGTSTPALQAAINPFINQATIVFLFNREVTHDINIDSAVFKVIEGVLYDGIKNFQEGMRKVLEDSEQFMLQLWADLTGDMTVCMADTYDYFDETIVQFGDDVGALYDSIVALFDGLKEAKNTTLSHDYEPSKKELRKIPTLDLMQAFDDIEATFVAAVGLVNNIKLLIHYDYSQWSALPDLITTVISTVENLKVAYANAQDEVKKMGAEFGLSPTLPPLNFDSLKTFYNAVPDEIKNRFILGVEAYVIEKAANTTYGAFLNGFKGDLYWKLGDLMPTIDLTIAQIDLLDLEARTPPFCIPTPLIVQFCIRGYFGFHLGITIKLGTNGGGLVLTIAPDTEIHAGIEAGLSVGIGMLGFYVEGIFAQGTLPFYVEVDLMPKIAVAFGMDLYFNPYQIEVGAFVEVFLAGRWVFWHYTFSFGDALHVVILPRTQIDIYSY